MLRSSQALLKIPFYRWGSTHKCFMVSHCQIDQVELGTSTEKLSYYYHCHGCGKYYCENCPTTNRLVFGDRVRYLCSCGDYMEEYLCHSLHGYLEFVINCSQPTWHDFMHDPSGRKKNQMQIEEICRILRSTFTGVGTEIDAFARWEGQRIIRFHTTNFTVKACQPSIFEVVQHMEVSLQTMKVQIEGLQELRGRFQLLTRNPYLDICVFTRRDGTVKADLEFSRKKKIRQPFIETIYESRECVICLGNPSEIVFSPCGHLCACKACGDRLENCCICRVAIHAKIPHDQRLDVKKAGKASAARLSRVEVLFCHVVVVFGVLALGVMRSGLNSVSTHL